MCIRCKAHQNGKWALVSLSEVSEDALIFLHICRRLSYPTRTDVSYRIIGIAYYLRTFENPLIKSPAEASKIVAIVLIASANTSFRADCNPP